MAIIPVFKRRPAPPDLQKILDNLPPGWVDDGLSNFPDSIFGWDIREAGTGHDFFTVPDVGHRAPWIRSIDVKPMLTSGSGFGRSCLLDCAPLDQPSLKA